MPKIVFDIETVGEDFDLLDDTAKEFFLKFADTDEKIEEAKNSLNFYPVSAQIVAIGMLEVETDKGLVLYQNGGEAKEKFTEGSVTYISGNESDILASFWQQMNRYDQFVTFNGRVFDCPFVMLRSSMHKIRSMKNMMPYRYSITPHIDLADQLSFYDAVRRKFSLHMWCRAYGITSPKEEGMSGLDVKNYYKDKRYKEIAKYCFGDIRATKELYLYWEKYLKF